MSPTSRIGRRQWFAQIIAFIAAILTPKPTTTLSAAEGSSTCLKVLPDPLATMFAPQQLVYAWKEDGHIWYQVWPAPAGSTRFMVDHRGVWEFTPDDKIKLWTEPPMHASPFHREALNFHRDAFTFESPRIDDELPKFSGKDVDAAFGEVNAMIDRWNAEGFYKIAS